MAAPNLVTPGTINGKTAVLVIPATATALLSVGAGSNQMVRLASLLVSNTNATTAYLVTADVYRSGVAYRLIRTMSIPASSSVVLVGRDAPIYLEEGDSLRLTADSANQLEAVCSYELVTA